MALYLKQVRTYFISLIVICIPPSGLLLLTSVVFDIIFHDLSNFT